MPSTPTTLAALPFYTTGRHPKPAMLRRCQADTVEELSSQEVFDRIRDLSLGLLRRGACVVRDDRDPGVELRLEGLRALDERLRHVHRRELVGPDTSRQLRDSEPRER